MRERTLVAACIALGCANIVVACASSSAGPGTTDASPAVTGIGVASGTPTTATIGAAGGQLASSDGAFTIMVPAGALAANTVIGVQPITNLAPGGMGTSYQLTPDGQTFNTPVQLVFNYLDAELLGSPTTALRIAYQDSQRRWHSIKSVSVNAATHQATITTRHFTDWARELGFHIEPLTASIEPGQSVELRIIRCAIVHSPDNDDQLTDLLGVCAPSNEPVTWTVNGVSNGNAANGTVTTASPGVYNYTAPAATPSHNPVAVSGTVFDSAQTILVTSNIDVGGHGVWNGTASFDMTFGQPGVLTSTTTIRTSVTWEYNAAAGGFRPQGNFSYDYAGTGLNYTPQCTTTGHASGSILFDDGTLGIVGLTYSGSGGKASAQVTQISNCNDSHTTLTTTGPTPIPWWPGGAGTITANGKTISGSSSTPSGFGTTTWSWTFTKQ